MQITMIGHSTVLIEAAGQRILTDPFFGAGWNPAFVRLAPPAATRAALQDVDLVLISHDHFDHADGAYLRQLPTTVRVLAPRPTHALLRLAGAHNTVGLSPWQALTAGEVTITAVPAIHWAVTVGYVIQAEGKCLYFAGDTFSGPFMQQIAGRFKLDAALLPVTTFRTPMTMGEKGAVRAVQTLNPGLVVPIHLGIQPRLPLMRTGQSALGFAERLRASGSPARVAILREGESCAV